MIFETHAHLNDARFDEDREAVIRRIRETGVTYLVNVGDSYESSLQCVELSKKYDFIYAAVGVHPEHADSVSDEVMDGLRELAELEKTVAIGEIGLDYHYEDAPDKQTQREAFVRQIELALSRSLPIIIHSRDACEDTLDILYSYRNSGLRFVMHCYSYSPEVAERIVEELGAYIGIGGVVTFKNAKKLKETVRRIPLEHLFLETDCPYMAPEPHRGERNDSSYLPFVAEQIAALKEISADEVYAATMSNAKNFFM